MYIDRLYYNSYLGLLNFIMHDYGAESLFCYFKYLKVEQIVVKQFCYKRLHEVIVYINVASRGAAVRPSRSSRRSEFANGRTRVCCDS